MFFLMLMEQNYISTNRAAVKLTAKTLDFVMGSKPSIDVTFAVHSVEELN